MMRRILPLAGVGMIAVWTYLSFGWATEGNGWTFLYLGAAGAAGAVCDCLKWRGSGTPVNEPDSGSRCAAAEPRTDQPRGRRFRLAFRLAFAVLFAIASAAAEYSLYSPGMNVRGFFKLAAVLLGSGAAAYWIAGLAGRLHRYVTGGAAGGEVMRNGVAGDAADGVAGDAADKMQGGSCRRKKPAAVFLAVFLLCFAVFFLYYRCIAYPGYLSNDSLDQLEQVLSGRYVNHHPFYHTILIGLFVKLAASAGGSVTAGVICYMIFQITAMSLIFAFAVMTLYQAGIAKGCVIAAALYSAFFPYHMDIISTLWKDILFAGCVVLTITAVYRCLRGIGRRRLNDAVLFAGGLGYCLFRTNGFAAFLFACALLVLVLVLKFKKQQIRRAGALQTDGRVSDSGSRSRPRSGSRFLHTRLLVILALTLLTAWVLKGPVLKSLDVESDYVGALAMPLQLLSRAYLEGGGLTEEELGFLTQIVPEETIKELYNPNRASRLMQAVRRGDGAAFYLAHRAEFYKIWLAVGLRHPGSYLRAWVDETRGYWYPGAVGINSGIPARTLKKNDYGIRFMIPVSKEVKDAVYSFAASPYRLPALHIFADIGLHVWLVIGLFFTALRRRDTAVLPLFVLSVMATLWATTPIYNQFRYAYAVFAALPFLAAALGAEKGSSNL